MNVLKILVVYEASRLNGNETKRPCDFYCAHVLIPALQTTAVYDMKIQT